MDKETLKNNILKKELGKTRYGNSIYSNLWYVCNKNKICVSFTPRGGCSISFQQFLNLVGLLEDGLNYNKFIHFYRAEIFDNVVKYYDINELKNKNYKFIKFIMNPYIRAVSIFRAQTSHNLSFRTYLKQLINNEIDYFNLNDKFHYHPQYIEGEENFITKYIKINENETYEIDLCDGTKYNIDVNLFTSIHHGIKNIHNKNFCGDILKNDVNRNLPVSYKYFYDDEIKQMVELYYKNDIIKYNFSFDNF